MYTAGIAGNSQLFNEPPYEPNVNRLTRGAHDAAALPGAAGVRLVF